MCSGLALNFKSSCVYFLNAGITSMYHWYSRDQILYAKILCQQLWCFVSPCGFLSNDEAFNTIRTYLYLVLWVLYVVGTRLGGVL